MKTHLEFENGAGKYYDTGTRLQLFSDGKISENNRAFLNSSLAFLDIDDFRHVNDTFGHEAGNVALIYIASCVISRYDFCSPVLDAINNSDQAMYQAKTTGKNRCVVA